MNTSFKSQKDASFTDDAGKAVAGRFLSDFDGNKFKLFGKAAESVELGVNYDFEVKSTDKYGSQLIDGKTFRKAGEAKPEPRHEESSEPRINQQKQSSIETQHAITKVVELRVGNVIDDDDPLYKAALSYIKDRVMGADNRVAQKATSPLVEAVKDAGGVEKYDGQLKEPVVRTKGEFANVGAFLNRCHQEYDLQRPAVEAILGEPITAKTDLDGAWLTVVNAGTK